MVFLDVIAILCWDSYNYTFSERLQVLFKTLIKKILYIYLPHK